MQTRFGNCFAHPPSLKTKVLVNVVPAKIKLVLANEALKSKFLTFEQIELRFGLKAKL